MKKPTLVLEVPSANHSEQLRSIGPEDLPTLRRWRNRHRQWFFQNAFVSRLDQARWFEEYQLRPNDFLFLILVDAQPTGCLGIRLQNDQWDLYNVLRGNSGNASQGCMSRALRRILKFARSKKAVPVTLRVLSENPATGWYRRNGFDVMADCGNHLRMIHKSPSQLRKQGES